MDLKMTMSQKKQSKKKIIGKQDLIMKKIRLFFYDNTDNIEKILPIINGLTKLSLRIIDWFVTNYAKKNNIVYYIDRKKGRILEDQYGCGDQFNVFLKYKSQLKSFSKKEFDPFCRRERIQFYYNENDALITTVGQLNFFKWAIENNVIDYINYNLKSIEDDMNTNIRKGSPKCKKLSPKKNKKSITMKSDDNTNLSKKSERKKRRELSVAATKTMNKHRCAIVLDFD